MTTKCKRSFLTGRKGTLLARLTKLEFDRLIYYGYVTVPLSLGSKHRCLEEKDSGVCNFLTYDSEKKYVYTCIYKYMEGEIES